MTSQKRKLRLKSTIDMSVVRADVAHALVAYTPLTMDARVWATLRDRVLALVLVLVPTSSDTASRMARVIAYYLETVVRSGVAIDDPDAVVFDSRRVESFIAANPTGVPGISTNDLRLLREYATMLNPAGAWPVRTPASRRHSRGAPYKGDEVPNILSAIKGLRRGKSRDRLTVAVNTVLGCGATSSELLALEWSAFYPIDGLGWVVALPGSTPRNPSLRSRVVPVAKPYISTLIPLIGERSGRLVDNTGTTDLAQALNSDSRSLRGASPVTMTRLRTTWMWERSQAGVNLIDVADAAGVRLEAVAVALDGHLFEDDSSRTARAFVRSAR